MKHRRLADWRLGRRVVSTLVATAAAAGAAALPAAAAPVSPPYQGAATAAFKYTDGYGVPLKGCSSDVRFHLTMTLKSATVKGAGQTWKGDIKVAADGDNHPVPGWSTACESLTSASGLFEPYVTANSASGSLVCVPYHGYFPRGGLYGRDVRNGAYLTLFQTCRINGGSTFVIVTSVGGEWVPKGKTGMKVSSAESAGGFGIYTQ